MAVVGERPESGVRIAIERAKSAEDAPWIYRGAAHLPDASFPLHVVIGADGTVTVTFPDAEPGVVPPDLAEKARLIVRTAYRQAESDGTAPAWRIVRWRAR